MRDQFRANARMLPAILLCLLFANPLAVTAAQETISSSKLTDSIVDIEESISRLRPLVEDDPDRLRLQERLREDLSKTDKMPRCSLTV